MFISSQIFEYFSVFQQNHNHQPLVNYHMYSNITSPEPERCDCLLNDDEE